MTIGAFNPVNLAKSTTTRPTRIMNAVNERRWYSDALETEVEDADLNDIAAQFRYAMDFYGITDIEGDDTLLKQIIAVGATSLSGNISYLQGLTGAADKVPYFTSNTAMALMTVTSFSRDLLAKPNASQWRTALGVDATTSDNVIAFSALTGSPDVIAYFTGLGALGLTGFTAFGRSLVDDISASTARTTLGLAAIAASASAADLTAGTLAAARLPASLASVHVLTPAANKLAYYTGSATAALTNLTAFGISLIDTVDAPDARTLLGLAALASSASANDLTSGTLPSARLPASLSSIYGLTPAADRLPYYTGAATAALSTFTAFGRSLVDDADAAAGRTTLGLVAVASSGSATDLTTGTLASARLPDSLSSIYSLTPAADRLPYYTGASAAALSTFTAFGRSLMDDANAAAGRTTLGLGSLSTLSSLALSALSDTTISSPANGQFLKYDSVAAKWINGLGVIDTSTSQSLAINDNNIKVGKSTGSFGIITLNDLNNLTISGSSSTVVGGNIVLYGHAHATIPDRVNLRINGDTYIRIDPTAGLMSLVAHQFIDGSVAAPAITFTSDLTSGIYRNSVANEIRISVGGITQFQIGTSSAAFAQIPTAPTATSGSSSGLLATTAFVAGELTSYAPLASPALTGNPTAPTQAAGNNTTRLATTAFVGSAISAYYPRYFSIGSKSAASPTIAAPDYGTLQQLNRATGQSLVLPIDTTLAVPVGTWIDFEQIGVGQTTFSVETTGTLTSQGGLLKTTQYGIVRAVKTAANTWNLSGALSA